VPSHDRSQLELSTLGADTSRRRSSRVSPRLSHSTFYYVPLNPFAFRARECSQILARTARFNRCEFHRRTASRALWTLVLCVEHGAASVRRCKFSGKPTGCFRFERIRCNDAYLDVIELRAFEQPVFETEWPR
jgi:hypothetical protein